MFRLMPILLMVAMLGCGAPDPISLDEVEQPEKAEVEGPTTMNVTASEFRKQTVGGSFSEGEFYEKFGKPERVSEWGDRSRLYYECSDGTVRVEVPKAPFQYQGIVAPLSVDQT